MKIMHMCLEDKQNIRIYYISLIVIGLFLILPLIDTKIIAGHDHGFHIARIEAIAQALNNGVFPVRMYVDKVQFWGSPTGIFYPSVFLYIPALLKLAGLPTGVCYNIFIAMVVFCGLFSSWYGFSMLTKSKCIGFLSSSLFISSCYYLTVTYIRSAVGELLALSFMPIAIGCIFNIINKTKVPIKIYFLAIFSISAIIESHVLSSIYFAFFSMCYLIINYKKITLEKLKIIAVLSTVILLLNAFFIVPFLKFYKEVPLSFDFNAFSNRGVILRNLFYFLTLGNFWIVTGLCMTISIIFFSNNKSTVKKWKQYRFYFYCLFTGFAFLLMSSKWLWNIISPLKRIFEYMQFPWRLLGGASLFLCICAGYGLYLLVFRLKLDIKAVILLSALICSSNLLVFICLKPAMYLGNEFVLKPKVFWERYYCCWDEDYLYKDMDVKALLNQKNRVITDAKITNWKKDLTDISFSYHMEHDSEIVLPLANYPGYIVTTQTGDIVPIKENGNHMIKISLPKGHGEITIRYKGLRSFIIADLISVFTLLALIFSSILVKRKGIGRRLI